jgi:hypothetical protein
MQRMTDSMLHVPVSKGSFLWLQGLLSILTIVAIGAALRNPDLWIGIALAGAIQVFVAVWLLSFTLTLSGDTLEYRSLFGGVRRLRLVDIESSTIQIGQYKYGDRFRPPIRLCIKPKRHAGQRPFDINMKVFEARPLKELLEILGAT